jgi:hypothetical protein
MPTVSGSSTRKRWAVKRRQRALGLIAGASVLLALLAVFAIELANTQAKCSRRR